jgi:ligand-binding SRPBCC domain-containing protein
LPAGKYDGEVAKRYILKREQWVTQTIGVAFEFFSRAENLQGITPPWLNFQITQLPAELRAGAMILYELRIHRLPVKWKTEIAEWDPPLRFIDVQISGPYRFWHHTHTFVEEHGGTLIRDLVRYELPFGLIGQTAHWALVQRDLKRIFDYRGERLRELLGS